MTLAISLGFGSFLSRQKVTDPFLYYDMAFLKDQANNNAIIFPEDGPFASLALVKGRLILLRELVDATGISPDILQFVPFGSIVVPAMIYLVVYRLFRSPIVASLIAIYISINLSHAAAIYSVFAYALAIPIFLGVIILYRRYLQEKGAWEVLLLLLLFLTVQFIHYTIAVWIILFLIGANLMVWYLNRRNDIVQNYKLPSINYLTLIFIFLFLALNRTLFTAYIPYLGNAALVTAWRNFSTYLDSFWIRGDIAKYQMERAPSAAIISAVSLAIILLPILCGIIIEISRRHRWQDNNRNYLLPIMAGILLTGALDTFIYLFRGSFSTKFIALLFPVLALFYLSKLKKRWLLWGFAVSLVCLSIVKIVIFNQFSIVIGDNRGSLPSEVVSSEATWLDENIANSKFTMLADLNLYGQYLLARSASQSQPILLGMQDGFYDHIVTGKTSGIEPEPNIIVIDKTSSEPVMGFRWARFTPLKKYLNQIWKNTLINIIYDDGRVWFAIPINK